jgi:hypothetical protein
MNDLLRDSQYKLLLVFSEVRIIWIVYDQRTTESIGILTFVMAVIPKGTSRVRLAQSAPIFQPL